MKQHVRTPVAMLSNGHDADQVAPVADHHQHLFSPAIAALLATGTGGPQAITARDVVALLDAAGIRRALLLSVAYRYGSPARTVEDEYASYGSDAAAGDNLRPRERWAALRQGHSILALTPAPLPMLGEGSTEGPRTFPPSPSIGRGAGVRARIGWLWPYEGLPAAWGEFMAWIEANGHTPGPGLWECYVAGPEASPDPADWRTELIRPLIARSPRSV